MLDFLINYWPWLLLAFLLVDLVLVIHIFSGRWRSKLASKDRRYLQKQWQAVQDELSVNPRQAVLDGDKLVDAALKRLGHQGSLGEKLKRLPHLFSDIRNLWKAHLLRNRLAHELEVKLSAKEAARALQAFQRALKDLGAL